MSESPAPSMSPHVPAAFQDPSNTVHASGSLVMPTNITPMQSIRQSLVGQLAWMENLITDYNAKADQLSEDIKDIDRNMVKHIAVTVVADSSVMDVSLMMHTARESFAEKLASLEKLIDVHDRQANQLWLDIKALDRIIDDALRGAMGQPGVASSLLYRAAEPIST